MDSFMLTWNQFMTELQEKFCFFPQSDQGFSSLRQEFIFGWRDGWTEAAGMEECGAAAGGAHVS